MALIATLDGDAFLRRVASLLPTPGEGAPLTLVGWQRLEGDRLALRPERLPPSWLPPDAFPDGLVSVGETAFAGSRGARVTLMALPGITGPEVLPRLDAVAREVARGRRPQGVTARVTDAPRTSYWLPRLLEPLLTGTPPSLPFRDHLCLVSLQPARCPLTGLWCSPALRARVWERLAGPGAAERGTLAMMDVDLLKDLNDVLGLAAGDRALARLAAILESQPWPGAVLGRTDGDEFTAFLPGLPPELARERMEELLREVGGRLERTTLLGHREDAAGQEPLPSLSVGLAGFPEDGTELDSLLLAASQRLNRAKRSGRRRVEGPRPSRR